MNNTAINNTAFAKEQTKPGYKKTKLGWIPEEWKILKLEDVARFKNGKGHEKLIDEDGDFYLVNSKFVSTEGLVFKKTNSQLVPLEKDNIAIVMSDIPNGRAIAKCFYVNESNKYTLNQRIGGLTTKGIDSKYLFYSLNRNRYYLKFDDGVKQTNLRKQQVLDCPLRIPPLPEQQKIANILNTWDKAIAAQEQLIAQKQELKKGLMQELLTGKKRFDGFTEEWEEVKLGELAEVKRGAGSQYITYVNQEHKNAIRLIRITDFLSSDSKYILKTEATERFVLKEGDLLIAGTGATAGISFEVPKEFSGLVFSYNAPRIRVNKKIMKEFLIYYLKSDMILRQQLGLFTGNAQPFLDTKAIRRFRVMLPTVDEQKKIADVLSSKDKEIDILKEKVEHLKKQKQGLMQQLLTGEKRVKI
ncbi:restriction endonuclease subunit S [Nonlabens sp. SCSIO 43208]|uniref:restriction endonuclease subunit S n=1 Tax=Nonlabens sp. SCSIO 43208 TaxID=2793009 RepID=UPI003D6A39E3